MARALQEKEKKEKFETERKMIGCNVNNAQIEDKCAVDDSGSLNLRGAAKKILKSRDEEMKIVLLKDALKSITQIEDKPSSSYTLSEKMEAILFDNILNSDKNKRLIKVLYDTTAELQDKLKKMEAKVSLQLLTNERIKVLEGEITLKDNNLMIKDGYIEDKNKEISAKNEDIRCKDAMLVAKEESFASFKDTLKNKNIELVSIEEEIKSVDASLSEANSMLKARDEEVVLLKDALKHKNDQIIAKDQEIASLVAARRRTQHQPKVLTLQLGQGHTSCSICLSKYSTDINNKNDNVKKHLPVISASSKSCDHYFCHGCILKQQASIAEDNDGKVPKWIPCMICRTKTAFCPSEPKYHRMLIDILKQAKWTDTVEVKEEKAQPDASQR